MFFTFVEEVWSPSSKWYQSWEDQLLYSWENGIWWEVILHRKSTGSLLVVQILPDSQCFSQFPYSHLRQHGHFFCCWVYLKQVVQTDRQTEPNTSMSKHSSHQSISTDMRKISLILKEKLGQRQLVTQHSPSRVYVLIPRRLRYNSVSSKAQFGAGLQQSHLHISQTLSIHATDRPSSSSCRF